MKPQHQDPDILKHLYWDKQLSQRAIGQELGVASCTISLWMIKLGIPRRPQPLATHLGNANHVNLSRTAMSFLSGCLLGDGTITMNKSISALYQHTNKHQVYLEWLKEQLAQFGIETVGTINKIPRTYQETKYYAYRLCTRSYPEFTDLRQKWYQSGTKQPPHDYLLDSLALRQWYIDDGNYRERTHSNKYFSREVRISNFSFSNNSKQLLAKQLESMNIDVTTTREGFRIRNRCIDIFFSTIGPCPISIYQYKWPTEMHDK